MSSFSSNSAPIDEECCSICLEPKKKENGYAVLPCQHSFCLSCALQHSTRSDNCPLCRAQYNSLSNKPNKTLKPIHVTEFKNLLHKSKKVRSYKYKNESINFEEFLKVQFNHYKNKSLDEFLKSTMNGIDRLSEITTYLVTNQYIQQLMD